MKKKMTAGFTLVELIVVIAILGILAGVGTVGYSGYIKKANMAADETLISNIKYALNLAMLDTNGSFGGGMVKVTTTGASVDSSSETAEADEAILDKAMTAAFGDNWADVCKLSYNGWGGSNATGNVAAYQDSSYAGNEGALVKQVGILTNAMGAFFSTGRELPDSLKTYMDANGVAADDSTGIANSALLALAGTLSGTDDETVAAKEEIETALTSMVTDYYENGNKIDKTTEKLQNAYKKIYTDEGDKNMVTLATAATLYAYAEAFSQYAAKEHGYNGGLTALHGIEFDVNANGTRVLAQVVGAFDTIIKDVDMQDGEGDLNASDAGTAYFGTSGQAGKDANGFFAVLNAVNDSSDALSSDLSNPNFYTDGKISNLLDAYLSVGSANLADGEAAVIVNPNKSVVAYLGALVA